MEENTIKISHILFMILMMGVVIIVGTYAWLSYRSNKTAMVLTIGEINNVQVTLSPYQIKASLFPQVTYTSDKYVSVTAVNNSNSPSKIKLFYKIDHIDSELAISDFKYTIEKSTDGTTYSEYKTGNFSSASDGGKLTILEESIPGNRTTYNYKVYIWLDASNGNQSYIQGKSFSGDLNASINSAFLPIEYQQILYLQSTGTQYIDTGVDLFSVENHKIIIDFEPTILYNYNTIWGTSYDADTFEGWIYGNGNLASRYNNTRYGSDNSVTINNRYTLELQKNGTTLTKTLNNNLIGSNTASSKITSANFYLFLSGSDYGKYKLYSSQLYKNNELVRDFVPCYRKSDNVAGLYDIINGTFYTNAGSGTFEIGPKILPNEYQYVEYLESTGTQYINTGFIPTTTTNMEIDFKYLGSGTSSWVPICGERSGNSSTYLNFFIKATNLKITPNYAGFDPGNNSGFDPITVGVRYKLKNQGGNFYLDDELKDSTTNTLTVGTTPIYVFAIGNTSSGVDSRQLYMQLYSFKIFNDNELMMNLIPAYRKSDKVRGLYDTVNDTFYTNAGSGTFEIGPEI